uniref:RISC-loading complex subunit tarbp2 n=1 Tax=Schizaphis graminum TaxID=13262 RepID=A0A2S2PDG6_SCHGA
MPKNEDQVKNNIYNLENTNIDDSEHESKTMIAKTQKNKTAISLLNEWAMRGDGTKPFVVSYMLMAITGHAHKPIFTYMCQIDNIKVLGEGKSKKEAKQNAAAQMCKKHFDFKIDFLNDNDKIITSTTTTDNFEVNENVTFLSSNEGSQIIDEINSDMGDEELQFKNEEVQIAYCDMNPVGALQELCTTYKWIPPSYCFDILNKNQRECKIVLYKVICEVFHLQTMGTASVKKEAKRKAARLMFEKIFDIGVDKLNELKSSYPITLLPTEDDEQNKSNIYNEENQKLSNKWFSAYCFRSYFTEAIAARTKTNDATIIPLIENKDNPMEIEQYIENYDPNASNVNKLNTLCKELGFQAIYVCLGVQKKEGQDEKYAVLVQVTSLPVTVTTGYGATADIAAEEAAKSILQTFKAMLLFTKPATLNLNNNEEEKIVNVL